MSRQSLPLLLSLALILGIPSPGSAQLPLRYSRTDAKLKADTRGTRSIFPRSVSPFLISSGRNSPRLIVTTSDWLEGVVGMSWIGRRPAGRIEVKLLLF